MEPKSVKTPRTMAQLVGLGSQLAVLVLSTMILVMSLYSYHRACQFEEETRDDLWITQRMVTS
jgi:hypothetical protein